MTVSNLTPILRLPTHLERERAIQAIYEAGYSIARRAGVAEGRMVLEDAPYIYFYPSHRSFYGASSYITGIWTRTGEATMVNSLRHLMGYVKARWTPGSLK